MPISFETFQCIIDFLKHESEDFGWDVPHTDDRKKNQQGIVACIRNKK